MEKKMKMTPLTPSSEVVNETLPSAFCATLPTAGEARAGAKAFCATLPSDAGEVEIEKFAKAFCATLPTQAEIRDRLRNVARSED